MAQSTTDRPDKAAKQYSPRFSVVIPCYNEETYIAQRLASLQQQDFKGVYEIIVVDNNCTDGTSMIALRMGARVITEMNPGVCWARQAGTQAALGEIIVSTDADTTNSSNWLSSINELFEMNPNIVAVGGACRYTDPWWGKLYTYLLFTFVQFVYVITGRTIYVSATNIAFRKSAWAGYDTDLTQGGDEMALLKSLHRRGKVVFIGTNPAQTSGRRLQKGILHGFFISLLFYYFLGYNLRRLFGIRVIGTAPAYRTKTARARQFSVGIPIVVFLLIGFLWSPQLRNSLTHTSYRLADKVAETFRLRDLI